MNAPDAIVVDTARRLFDDLERAPGDASPETLRARWAAVEATGLDRVLVPEALGGVGADLSDAIGLMRAAGRAAVALPLFEGVVARWLLAHAGRGDEEGLVVAATLLPAVAPVAAAQGGNAPSQPAAPTTAALRRVAIPFGRAAPRCCVVDVAGGAARLALFDVDAHQLVPSENLAGEPCDRLPLPADVAWHPLPLTPDRIAGVGALLRAAQMQGAMERVLAIAVEHASTREQFGKPIGRFQAIQQMLAVLAGQVAAVAAAVDGAVDGMRADAAWIGGALAKARASEAVALVNANAHQVTAAMGFTREFPLHRYTRRLWSWRDDWGSEQDWHERLGALALAQGGAKLWAFVVDPEGAR